MFLFLGDEYQSILEKCYDFYGEHLKGLEKICNCLCVCVCLWYTDTKHESNKNKKQGIQTGIEERKNPIFYWELSLCLVISHVFLGKKNCLRSSQSISWEILHMYGWWSQQVGSVEFGQGSHGVLILCLNNRTISERAAVITQTGRSLQLLKRMQCSHSFKLHQRKMLCVYCPWLWIECQLWMVGHKGHQTKLRVEPYDYYYSWKKKIYSGCTSTEKVYYFR